jgi:chromate transporter
MATFVGSSQGGFLGALLATLGVVTPSFLIILLIASLFTRLMKYGAVRAGLSGIRPAIVSLILATGLNMLLNLLFGINSALATPILEWRGILIFLVIIAASLGYNKLKSKKISPILLIILSGILGMILY